MLDHGGNRRSINALKNGGLEGMPSGQQIDAQCIETSRLVLRPPVYADGLGLHALLADPRACRFSPHPLIKDIAVTRFLIVEWRELWVQGLRTFVVTHVDRRRDPIGFINIGADGELGGMLSPLESGCGIATEALRAIIDALSDRGMWSIVDAEHHRLIHSLEKVGFEIERRLAAHRVHPQISPQLRDCVLMRRPIQSEAEPDRQPGRKAS